MENLKIQLIFLKIEMKVMTSEERIELIYEFMTNYCENCGSEHLPCYCMCDD